MLLLLSFVRSFFLFSISNILIKWKKKKKTSQIHPSFFTSCLPTSHVLLWRLWSSLYFSHQLFSFIVLYVVILCELPIIDLTLHFDFLSLFIKARFSVYFYIFVLKCNSSFHSLRFMTDFFNKKMFNDRNCIRFFFSLK